MVGRKRMRVGKMRKLLKEKGVDIPDDEPLTKRHWTLYMRYKNKKEARFPKYQACPVCGSLYDSRAMYCKFCSVELPMSRWLRQNARVKKLLPKGVDMV